MRYTLSFFLLILATACTNSSQQQLVKLKPVDQAALQQMVTQTQRPYVVVNFFTTYCKPCEKEIPDLWQMNQAEDAEAEILFVSMDENQKELPTLINGMFDRMGLSFQAYHYTLSEAETFIRQVYPEWRGDIPLNLIFRKDGHLVTGLGMTDPVELTMIIHNDQSFRQ